MCDISREQLSYIILEPRDLVLYGNHNYFGKILYNKKLPGVHYGGLKPKLEYILREYREIENSDFS